ncbi:uncharacterized protein LOC114618089 [Grammomys surdaster]|uniref:uncharacterized protein LOC114618089 n=1 Tax=Grammomys surdaster TaxID=491861 RepID=UPI00109F9E1A|nr:uncharacterized protein LOC114618089 [Grammomys surdaster]
MVVKLVNHLVPFLWGGDPFFAPAFLDVYRSFTTTQHVLDLLLKWYADFHSDCIEDELVKSILCYFLDTWIDKYPEEFCQTSDLSILRKLKAYLIVNMSYSDLNLQVHNLLMELQQESNESEIEDEDDSDQWDSALHLQCGHSLISEPSSKTPPQNPGALHQAPEFSECTQVYSDIECEAYRRLLTEYWIHQLSSSRFADKTRSGLKFCNIQWLRRSRGVSVWRCAGGSEHPGVLSGRSKPLEEKTMVNEQLPHGNMESMRPKRQRCLPKLNVTHAGIWPWIETEAKTWNELKESLTILKAAKKMRCRIQRVELENANLVITIEKQAREMKVLREKLLDAGINVVEAAREGEPGEKREETCKCPERSCSNPEGEMRWKTSSMVALVGPHPECPQGPYLTSSTMGPQGNVLQPSQCPEASCECMENPRSWSQDKEKAHLELISSVRSLLCALHQETRRTKKLQKELAEMKKIFNMPPQEGHGHEGRGHSFREVSKVSQAEMGVPVAMRRLEGEAATAENFMCTHESPNVSYLTQMELEMKSIESAIAEVNTQECLVKKELEVTKQLYRGELERMDSMSLEGATARDAWALPQRHSRREPSS